MYRAVSFWMDWRFLDWPNEQVHETIVRRCDEMAAADVNTAIIFGTHFRWDFLPILSRVHDLLAFISGQLHQRNIKLFDHHSSVLTHRIRTPEDRRHIRTFNYHHLPFYPDTDYVPQMKYNGSPLNDWRMIDVETGLPIYIDTYRCEQFCMNNPDFRAAYQAYLRQLLRDVPLDGLMSDDGVYYAGWRACGCRYCREKFAAAYGHSLPPVSDSSFWFNRENPAFQDWIDFRYSMAGEFLSIVKQTVGDLPLMTCCSNSSGQACNTYATSYEEFAPHATLSMLEICGNGVDPNGNWSDLVLGRAMMQLAITRRYALEGCLALGYGFTRAPFEMFWRISRLLGADVWLSTLKGRLVPKCSEIDSLPEEPSLLGNLFTWEKNHEELFNGVSDAKVCVFHSRDTRDHFTRSYYDFEAVYKAACGDLFDANITFDVICDLDEIAKYTCLVLPAAACLSNHPRNALRSFLQRGGILIAIGPTGIRNLRGGVSEPFLAEFGVDIHVDFPSLPRGYQSAEDVYELPGIHCSGAYNGTDVKDNTWATPTVPKGNLYWTPSLNPSGKEVMTISDVLQNHYTEPVQVIEGLTNWRLRRYRRENRIVLVGMNSNITPTFSKKFALSFGSQPIVESLAYQHPCRRLKIKTAVPITSARLFATEFADPCIGTISPEGTEVSFSCDEIEAFFVVELLEK